MEFFFFLQNLVNLGHFFHYKSFVHVEMIYFKSKFGKFSPQKNPLVVSPPIFPLALGFTWPWPWQKGMLNTIWKIFYRHPMIWNNMSRTRQYMKIFSSEGFCSLPCSQYVPKNVPICFHFFPPCIEVFLNLSHILSTCSLCCSHSSHVVVKFIPLCFVKCSLLCSHGSHAPHFIPYSLPKLLQLHTPLVGQMESLHQLYVEHVQHLKLVFLWWANQWSLSLEEMIWIFYDSR